MTLIEHPDLVQGTEEWLAARRGMVTASTVGRLITTRSQAPVDFVCPDCQARPGNPCTSVTATARELKTTHPARNDTARAEPPRLVVADDEDSRALTAVLVAERITGWTEPVRMTDAMWRGVEDEPRARQVYADHCTIQPVTESGFMVEDKWGFPIGYSPDGLVGDDGLIEIKSRAPKKQLQTVLAGEVPAENMAQLQCGLLVSGRAWCDYVSYCGGMPLWVKRVLPDQRWFDVIVAAVQRFEDTAAAMVATYEARTDGLPPTERINLDEIAI